MKICLKITKPRSPRWTSFLRAAKKHPSFMLNPKEPETVFLTFTNAAEVNDYLITCMNWVGLTIHYNDRRITPHQAWDLCNDVISLRERGCPEHLIEESLDQGAARKDYVRDAMRRVSVMLAAELGIPSDRVQVEAQLNMPPYFQKEAAHQTDFPEKGPFLILGVINSPTLWQIDLLSHDTSADYFARNVRSALQAVAWQLDKPTPSGPLIEAAGIIIPLGNPVPQPSGRLRLSNIEGPIDGSGFERGNLRRFIYRLEVELPAINAELTDDSEWISNKQKRLDSRE